MRSFLAIPCLGGTSAVGASYARTPTPFPFMGPFYPPLLNKLGQAALCNHMVGGLLHCADNFSTNRSYFFLEINRIEIQVPAPWGWKWMPADRVPPICLYVGSYPNYWDYQDNILRKAHNMRLEASYAMGRTPDLPDVWWWIISTIKPEEYIDYFGTIKGTQLLAQKRVLDARAKALKDCRARNYPMEYPPDGKPYRPRDITDEFREAWSKLGLGRAYSPELNFNRYTKQQFDDLKQKYVEKYGYTIQIPQFDDIIHWKPTSMKTDQEIKEEKRRGLLRVLQSPAPDIARAYSSAMTWLDDIQDTGSVVYPGLSLLARWAPKIFGRMIPYAGWTLLGMDLLNLLIGVGRLPMTGLGGKRLHCEFLKTNPFAKESQSLRKERIRNWKPGFADILQALQTTDQLVGVGISLGSIMGAVMDTMFGGYKYLTGENVRISFEPPPLENFEIAASKGLQAAAVINSYGQAFSELTHFWAMTLGGLSAILLAPITHNNLLGDIIEDPMKVLIPAPTPTDPITIEVIKEQGLDIDNGVRWPYNGAKELTLDQLTDFQAPAIQRTFNDYCQRHNKDWYGFVAANTIGMSLGQIIDGLDPSGDTEYSDRKDVRVAYTMVKAPLIPTRELTPAEYEAFKNFIDTHEAATGHTPGLRALEEFFSANNIPVRTSWPTTREPQADLYWPPDFTGSEYSNQ